MVKRALWIAGLLLTVAHAAGDSLRPGSLLIYYGYPSSLNYPTNQWDMKEAVKDFGRYDYAVLGDGLWDGEHPDHANTLTLLHSPATVNTTFFGYVDLGVYTQNHSAGTIQRQVDAWQSMGVDGIFLDDFGYDFGTSRARQNAAVDYVHERGMPVVANGFRVDEVFGRLGDDDPPHLNGSDYYLYESHQITSHRRGPFIAEEDWQEKATKLRAFQREIGFEIFSVTTIGEDDIEAFSRDQWYYAWYSALLYGHEAVGWGEHLFSCCGNSNGLAPFRERPDVDPGTSYLGEVVPGENGMYTRATDSGEVYVNAREHTAAYSARDTMEGTAIEDGTRGHITGAAILEQNYPNPFNAETVIRCALPTDEQIELSIYSLSGQKVAILLNGRREAGTYAVRWDARDDGGLELASGVYLCRLRTSSGQQAETRKLLLLR